MALVLPGIGASPVAVERLLHLLHLLHGSLFGILLHAGVDGGIDFQSVLIEVVAVLRAPFLQVVLHRLTEIEGLSVVVVLNAKVQLHRLYLQRVVGFLCQVFVLQHIVKHNVTAIHGVLRIDARIVIGGCFQQTHEDSSLVGCQVLGSSSEIGLGGSLDAKGVRTEVHSIGIHGQNLLLVEEEFDFHSSNPLLALHY